MTHRVSSVGREAVAGGIAKQGTRVLCADAKISEIKRRLLWVAEGMPMGCSRGGMEMGWVGGSLAGPPIRPPCRGKGLSIQWGLAGRDLHRKDGADVFEFCDYFSINNFKTFEIMWRMNAKSA